MDKKCYGYCFIQADNDSYIKADDKTHCPCVLVDFTCPCCERTKHGVPEWFKYTWRGKCLNCDIMCKDKCVYDPRYNLCTFCGGALVPIGKSRSNGKHHNDWKGRTMHKKCWLELQKDKK